MGNVVNSSEDSEVLPVAINLGIEWAELWQMEYNVDKCKVMHFGKKIQNVHIQRVGSCQENGNGS